MCDPLNVLDKDGISALVVGAEMCVYLRSIGRTLTDQLHHLSLLYGFHLNNNSYVLCPKTDLMLNIFHRLRHFDEQNSSPVSHSSSSSLLGSEMNICFFKGTKQSSSSERTKGRRSSRSIFEQIEIAFEYK